MDVSVLHDDSSNNSVRIHETKEQAMNAKQLRELVIRPVLQQMNMWSEQAENLLLGTACQESHCGEYIRQLGCTGPRGAFGIYQMELATARDIYDNYLTYKREELYALIENLKGISSNLTDGLTWNLAFATAMTRVFYLRIREPIPYTVEEQAKYWKKYYNTSLGKGTVEEYINNWHRYSDKG